jgi:hypothetical protein
MAQQFGSIEEVNDYIDFLEMKGKPIPQWVQEEKARMERENSIPEDEFIFGTMAANNPFMTAEKETVVRDMVDQLMKEDETASQPCLLLGKVQCGKTDTFLSIMGLCFDRGIDIAVVMTKGTNTLTKQTIQRLNHDFRFFKDKQTYGQKVIISVWDILDLGHRGGLSDYQLNDPANKFIIVVKKEDTNLKYLNEIFENSEVMRGKKVLVCDDEADFASRNYYQRKGEISLMKIAEHIEKFITLPYFCRYLQITATPYSLYLQPDGSVQLRDGEEASPWLPRYTGLVPIHAKYIGGKQYYELSEDENSMYSCLFEEVTEDCIDILSARNEFYLENNAHSERLDSLNYAVVSYLFAAAVRSIQVKKKENKKYYSSCLIHCEVAKRNHAWQEELITQIIETIRDAFVNKSNSDLHILDLERDAYDSLKHSNELGNKYELIHERFPTFGEVEAEVKRILEYNDYVINVVNSENPVSTMLNEKGQLRLEQALNFFIGGNILDRGITIDNMLCFFYGRDPKKFQMDTVLQHARMYGARDKEDMACTRFFTTKAIYDVLKTINGIDSMMYEYLKSHRDTVRTNDFISMVIGYDKRVNATAASKYTPANTKVLQPGQRMLPKGFQTGTEAEITEANQRIDELITSCPGYKDGTEEDPYFMMPYATAAEILNLIGSTYRYAPEYQNVDYEWDTNEMITPLEHCCYNTDGNIYCRVFRDRNLGRIREMKTNKGPKFEDSPEGRSTYVHQNAEKADERPVLTLIQQNGSAEKGWNDAPFFWPVLVMPKQLSPGIFTVNGNKKFRAPKKQVKPEWVSRYPLDEVLVVSVRSEILMNILANVRHTKSFDLKRTTSSLFIERDLLGNACLVEGTDPNKYYDLSSYNDGVFPYVIKDYKYIYFRNSMDYSGSQALVAIDANKPYELFPSRFTQDDVVYDEMGNGTDAYDESCCWWRIEYTLGDILEKTLTPQDEEYLEEYKAQLAEDFNNRIKDCEEIYIEQLSALDKDE